MTTEDDFQKALDAHPDDWQTRLVFADWLDERNDPRADGYRALGALRRRAKIGGRDCIEAAGNCWMGRDTLCSKPFRDRDESWKGVPDDWFVLACNTHWLERPSRREVENEVALAFAKLPEARRAELLSTGGAS